MTARLQRFYGASDPTIWLQMPYALTARLLEMIPILEARESVQHTREIAVGTGSLKRHESSRILSEWTRAMQGRGRGRRRRGPREPGAEGASRAALFQALAMSQIEVEIVPSGAAAEE